MSAILLDTQLVHYEVLGRGRPVIFLHGWLGSWRYWISAMQVTSTSYRAYTLDLWGFGDSPHIENRYTVPRQTELLKNFFAEMGIGRVALVGHGLGALVAMYYALAFPNSVDRMMLVAAPLSPDAINPRLGEDDLQFLADWLAPESEVFMPVRLDLPKQDPLAVSESYARLQQDTFFWQRFRELRIPSLFVHGDRDPLITPLPDFESIMRYNFHQIILEDSGHFPMLEQNVRFNRLLADFLALESGDSPRELQLKEEWKRRVR